MSYQLKLNVGDAVRNIRINSRRKGMVGVVVNETMKRGEMAYTVKYNNGEWGTYFQCFAHQSLEKLVTEKPESKVNLEEFGPQAIARALDKMNRQEVKAFTLASRYGGYLGCESVWKSLLDSTILPKRKVLKKTCRNLITGKTKDDMIKELGPARGVSEFYTRATGRSSGQAMVVLGAAMQSPGFAVPFLGVDHHNNEPGGRGLRHKMDDHMQDTIMHIICKLDWRGFTIHTGDRTVTFNPIVTEETYVEHK